LSPEESASRAQGFADFFSKKIETIVAELEPHVRVPSLTELHFFSSQALIKLEETSAVEISNTLRRLQSNKCSPDDFIPTFLFKQDKQICALVADICNESFRTGSFPRSFKKAIIIPVIKKFGLDSEEITNYRPISNIKLIGKLIESVAHAQLMKHLEKINFLHSQQSAYRKYYSTETAVLHVTEEWRKALDKGKLVCVASLDVTAAFDTVID
jgi:hypothetical protein